MQPLRLSRCAGPPVGGPDPYHVPAQTFEHCLPKTITIARGGAAMVLFGLAIATGELTRFAIWFMATFPWLASLG